MSASRILSWNVNGLRALHEKGSLLPWLNSSSPTIACFQETKASENKIASIPFPDAYSRHTSCGTRAGYAGTLTLTAAKGDQLPATLPILLPASRSSATSTEEAKLVDEGRVTPNTGHRVGAPSFRAEWDAKLLHLVQSLRKEHNRPIIVAGDLNVAHMPIDLAHPEANREKAGYSTLERNGLSRLLNEGELVDSFRHFHPGLSENYTYWDYRTRSRVRNVGWRLDYILVDRALMPNVRSAFIEANVLGSDHCPVGIEIDSDLL